MRIEGPRERTDYLPTRGPDYNGDALAYLELGLGTEIRVYPATPKGLPFNARIVALNGQAGDVATRNAVVERLDKNNTRTALGGGTACEIITPVNRR